MPARWAFRAPSATSPPTASMTRTGSTLSFPATTSEATVVNLTNHSYGTLQAKSPARSITRCSRSTPTASHPWTRPSIPTGAIQPVAGTPFDFTTPKAIGENLSGGAGFTAADNEQLRRCNGYD